MVIQQPQRGILGKVAWKCIFVVTDMRGWGFCLEKQIDTNSETMQKWVLAEFTHNSFCRALILVFILSFLPSPPLPLCLCFYYGDITPRVRAELHNKWLFWDSVLRIHCQLSPVAWGGFLLNTPPCHWGMGWDDRISLSWVHVLFTVSRRYQAVLLFVFRGQFIFNLAHRNFLVIISSYLVFLVSISGRNIQDWFGVS